MGHPSCVFERLIIELRYVNFLLTHRGPSPAGCILNLYQNGMARLLECYSGNLRRGGAVEGCDVSINETHLAFYSGGLF